MTEHERQDIEALQLANSHNRHHKRAQRDELLRHIDAWWVYTATIVGLLLALWVARETGALIGALTA